MPPLLAPIIAGALASTALSSAAVFAVSQIAAYALVAGAAYGLQALIAPNTPAQKVAAQQYQTRQPLPSLIYGYGTNKFGGNKFVFEAPNGSYIDGIAHCCGPISRVKSWILNDQITTLPPDSPYADGGYGGPNPALPWGSNVILETRKGGINQRPNSILMQTLSGTWTEDHRLDGICASVLWAKPVKEKVFQKVYPNGPPSAYIIADTAPVYDPRDPSQDWDDVETWKFSKNPALALLHYLTALRGTDVITGSPVPFGFGFKKSKIDIPSFIAFANVCDEPVLKKDGSTEPRYEIGGTFDMGTDELKTVLQKILATCDGELYQSPLGKICVRGGIWTPPTITLTQDHILGYEFEQGEDKLAVCNHLKIRFCDPQNDYQIIDGDPWDDIESQLLLRDTVSQDLTLPMVQSHSQARRLAKIAMAKVNPKDKLTVTTDLYGLLVFGERIITLDLPEMEIYGTFQVISFVENAAGTCTIGLSSLESSAYAWNAGVEEGTPPVPANSTVQVSVVPDIVNAVYSVEKNVVSGTVTGLSLRVSVDAPTNTTYQLKGRIRKLGSGDDSWVDMLSEGMDWNLVYRPLDDNQDYEPQIAFQAPYGGTQGPWVPGPTVRAVADDAPAGPTTGLSANGGGGRASYAFTTPNVANYGTTQVYRNTVNSIAGASSIKTFNGSGGQSFDSYDNGANGGGLTPGTYYYWTKVYNKSGYTDASCIEGPKEVTVT